MILPMARRCPARWQRICPACSEFADFCADFAQTRTAIYPGRYQPWPASALPHPLDQHAADISDERPGFCWRHMQPPVQYLRDDALQRRDEHRGALDHDAWRHAGAGETHREDLQGIDNGGVEIRKFVFGVDPRSSHQMK